MSILNFLTSGYKTNRVNVYSGYASFFITVSSVPFLALVFYIVGCLSPSLEGELIDFLSALVPSDILLGFELIIEEIRGSELSLFLPISIITLVWSACKGTGGLSSGIENIYFQEKRHCNYFLKIVKNFIYTVVFTLIVILSLAVCSLGREILEGVISDSIWLERILSLRFFAFFFMLFIIFLLLYRHLSLRKGIINHIFGALFSTFGWFIFTFVYSKYISYALSSHSIYAGVGALVFFMLWVYFLVNIILIGALINVYYIKKHEKPAEYDRFFIKR